MYRLTRNLHIFALITLIIFVSGWYYQHYNTNRSMLEGARKLAEISVLSLSEDISGWLSGQARTIEAAADFIAIERWSEEDILVYLPITNTDWHLASFIPLTDFMSSSEQMTSEFILAGIMTILVFLLFLFYHYIYVSRPILILEKNIKQLDIEDRISFRLPVDEKNDLAALGNTINRLLDKIQAYFKKLVENEELLKKANCELEAMVRQLTTAEEALDYSEEKLYYLSYHDQLTGLYNRAFFEAKLRHLSGKPEYPITIISADIDGLKLINDTIGHSAGNKLLKVCAEVISDALNGTGILARVGGDEFTAILPLASKTEGENVARQIRYQVFRYNQDHANLPLSLSMGVATAEDDSTTLKKLLKQADDLMTRNKLHCRTSARNGVVQQSLMAAMAEGDYYTDGHARRLESICLSVGELYGLSSRQLSDLALLARVHDLGKVGSPDQILLKNGPLNDEAWQIMKQHSEKGYRIASSSSDLSAIADLILKHHERWDGRGYPLGLKEQEIPIECRILAVVDAYDAMTNDRPYKLPVTPAEALLELQRCSGSQFDPMLVDLFISLMAEKDA